MDGLAVSMTYGDGTGNTVTHKYGGAGMTPKRKTGKQKKSKKGKK